METCSPQVTSLSPSVYHPPPECEDMCDSVSSTSSCEMGTEMLTWHNTEPPRPHRQTKRPPGALAAPARAGDTLTTRTPPPSILSRPWTRTSHPGNRKSARDSAFSAALPPPCPALGPLPTKSDPLTPCCLSQYSRVSSWTQGARAAPPRRPKL